MKKNLLVTLADKNYIDQAKQLFSSVYFNAGWQGDYMLLAHEMSEVDLQWFRGKGILIRKCSPLYQEKVGGMTSVVISKSYLFTTEFKAWQNIIYLDADTTVRASLEELTAVKGLFAVPDIFENKIVSQIINYQDQSDNIIDQEKFNQIIKKLKLEYDLNAPSFNTGVMAFSSDIIKDDSFSRLLKFFEQYGAASAYGEQLILNLFFYKQWNKLPPVYNIYLMNEKNQWQIKPKNIKGKVIHFLTLEKPWVVKNYFYKEWQYNKDRADLINLQVRQPGKEWKNLHISGYSHYLKNRYMLYYAVDKLIETLARLNFKIRTGSNETKKQI